MVRMIDLHQLLLKPHGILNWNLGIVLSIKQQNARRDIADYIESIVQGEV